MKKITLEKIYDTLKNEKNKVEIEEKIRLNGKKALDRMLQFS